MAAGEAGGVTNRDHPALLYRSTDEFLDTMAPYVLEGLHRDEVVFVAIRGDNVAALQAELGDRAGGARLVDTEVWHHHHASRLRAFHELVTDELAAGATGFRLAGEPVWPEGSPEEVREWQRYESALNTVLAPYPTTLVCLYDAARLDPSILHTATVTHATLLDGADERASEHFEEPEDFLTRWNIQLEPPPPTAAPMPGEITLSAARRFVAEQAHAAGLDHERTFDLCVATNEIVTNAIAHAPGVHRLWTWHQDDRFICHVEDRGEGIADALAGYRPPSPRAESGRGLWLARQLVDLLQIVSTPTGTSVRLHVDTR